MVPLIFIKIFFQEARLVWVDGENDLVEVGLEILVGEMLR